MARNPCIILLIFVVWCSFCSVTFHRYVHVTVMIDLTGHKVVNYMSWLTHRKISVMENNPSIYLRVFVYIRLCLNFFALIASPLR